MQFQVLLINMVLGYNKPRPTKENYQDFMNKIVKGLIKLGTTI